MTCFSLISGIQLTLEYLEIHSDVHTVMLCCHYSCSHSFTLSFHVSCAASVQETFYLILLIHIKLPLLIEVTLLCHSANT